jgi:uncharacterized Tic20 family protein
MAGTKNIQPSNSQPNMSWRYAYLFFYTVGGVFSCLTVGMLIWIAYCIAIEAEPLSAISFLPSLPTMAIFVILLVIMIISCAAWQAGAHYQQKFEKGFRRV